MYVSIVIPTHNRVSSLRQTIDSALALDYPRDCYEIIVVDNASTDDTARLVRNLQNDSNHSNLIYVREDQLGLHNARHAGAQVAKGEIVVFTDDDATFHPAWLQAYAEAFTKHPEMIAAGGPARPIWEAPPPEWLLRYMGDLKGFIPLSLLDLSDTFRLGLEPTFYGVNMAIRRVALFKVGGFNPEAFGDVWLGDGETGLYRKLVERKMLIGYVPDAVVHHHIPPHRMTVEYLCHRMGNEGACDAYAQFHRSMPSRIRLLGHAAGIVARNIKSWIGAPFLRGRTDARAIDARIHAAKSMSRLKYAMRLLLNKQFQQMVLKKSWLTEANSMQVTPRGSKQFEILAG